MSANRRQPRGELHAMYVLAQGDGLKVACACGVVVGGRRYEDRTMVTLSDLLELLRIHRTQLGGPE